MIKFILTFGSGVYCGVYLAQNHVDQVPQVLSPQEISIKIREWLDEYSKPPNN